MTDNSNKKDSRIFICYRNPQAKRAIDLKEWMDDHKSLYFGKVYCSNADSSSNFTFDINLINTAEYFIVFLHPDFTADFPETLDEYKNGKIITATEIGTLMDRVTDNSLPPINVIGIRIGDLTPKDEESITKIASRYGEITDEELITKRKNVILTSGFNRILPEESDKIVKTKFEEFFKNIALFHDPYFCKIKNRMSQLVTLHEILPQTFKSERNDSEEITSEFLASEIKKSLFTSANPFFIISGTGGMGKTTQLKKLCSDFNNDVNFDTDAVCIYMEARTINENEGRKNPFYWALAETTDHSAEALEAGDAQIFLRDKLFKNSNGKYIICIDGIDEINNIYLPQSEIAESVFTSIEELAKLGIPFILSARSRELFPHRILKYCAQDISINKLTYNDIKNQLPEGSVPQESSPLADLLQTPFYFSIYAETVGHFNALNELCDADPEIFYYHDSPTTPGELIWNYMMRNITKQTHSGGRLNTVAAQNIFFIMNVLPAIAQSIPTGMARKHTAIEKIYSECTEKFKSRRHWQPFWRDTDSTGFIERFFDEIPEFDDFIHFSTIAFPLLKKVINNSHTYYGFNHEFINDFFKALYIINNISDIEYMTDEELKTSFLNSDVLSESLVKLAGEICGERKETPYLDKENMIWESVSTTQNNLIRRTFNHLRGKKEISVLIFNLFNILKTARSNGATLPDMSDINFDGIDLTKCSVVNIIFSHTTGDSTIKASFKNAVFSSKTSFSEGHSLSENSSIKALFCPAPNLLLSADNAGTLIMWDTKYSVPTDKKSFSDASCIHSISDMTMDTDGNIWFACDDVLKCVKIDIESKSILSITDHRTKSKYIKHIGADKETGIYYHTADSPFDRRDEEGHVIGTPFGKWFEDAVVSKDGNTVYCLRRDNLSRSLQSICTYIRTNEGSWELDKIIANKTDLFEMTSHTMFSNGKLYLSEEKNILAVYFWCGGKNVNGLKRYKSYILEFDLKSLNISRLSPLTDINTGTGAISAMCMDSGGTFFIASGLDIFSMNRNFETRVIGMGKGQLLGAVFTPDTKSFIAVTTNPVRFQFFSCSPFEECRCIKQIALSRPRNIHRFKLAFQFKEDMEFDMAGMKGYAKYPNALKMVLWHKVHGYTMANLFKGKYSKFKDGTTIINTPAVSDAECERDRFIVKASENTIKKIFINREENETEEFIFHPEWLFAGCDFEGASFTDGNVPCELKIYAMSQAENTGEDNTDTDDDDLIDFTYEEE